MTKNIKIVLILLLASFQMNFAQDAKFDSLVTKGIKEIYNIQFDKAKETFDLVQKEYPNHPAGKFFSAMIIWWKITLDRDNETYDEIFEDRLEEVIDFCDEILDDDPKNVDAIFFKGGALGFRGRLYALRKEWFNAALDGKDALPLVFEAYKIDPTNEDVKLGFGIYNYYAESIPEKYPFIKPAMVFFPNGNKSKGIEQLKIAAKKAKYAGIEARFFLMTLYYQFEEDYTESLVYAKPLHEDFPNNPIFEKYYGRLFVKKGNYKKAAEIFSSINKKCNSAYNGYNKKLKREAVYYIGNNFYMQGKLDSAKKYFTECEKLSKKVDVDLDEESGFLINAALYVGMINDRLGLRNEAIKKYKQVLSYREYGNSHKKAKKYLKKARKP
jgi:tetratricopeptide (TPR) repeat protein